MTNEEIIGYVMRTPENTNPNVLRDMLSSMVTPSGGGITEVTYEEIYNLAASGSLTPGALYRITDFVTTVNGKYDVSDIMGETAYIHYARSAGHPFDLIVMAISEEETSEHAIATGHSGDDYFTGCALEQWDICYTLDNNPEKYAWADPINGKGVITYMRDEFGNEAGYDFKNVQILAYALKMKDNATDPDSITYSVSGHRYGSISAIFQTIRNYIDLEMYITPWSKYDFACGDTIFASLASTEINETYLSTFYAGWYYTFDVGGQDCSLNLYDQVRCYNNKITKCQDSLAVFTGADIIPEGINGSIFQNDDSTDDCIGNEFKSNSTFNIFGKNAINNKLDYLSYSNIFGNSAANNKFDSNCYYNVLGDDNTFNIFGDGCYENILGEYCYNNIFGYCCYYTTFGDYCQQNIFGALCESNTFESRCTNNIIENCCIENSMDTYCSYNTLKGHCNYNILGSHCAINVIGSHSDGNELGDYCISNTVGNNCVYVVLDGGNQFQNIKNYHICNGVSNQTIQGVSDAPGEMWVGYNSNSELVTWCPADLVQGE